MANILEKHEQLPQSQLFTCEICIEPMFLSSEKFKNNNKCTHPFCTDCIIKYIQVKVDDKVAKIPCPALDCREFLDPLSCKSLIGTQLFAQWCDVLCESALLGMDRCYCPNRNCSVLIVNECGDNVRRSTCCNCRTIFCFKCKLPWHAGLGCDRSIDVAFARLAQRNLWRRCPLCGYYVQKNGGCGTIYCRCGTLFCYKCGRPENQCLCWPQHTLSWRENFEILFVIIFPISICCLLLYLTNN